MLLVKAWKGRLSTGRAMASNDGAPIITRCVTVELYIPRPSGCIKRA
ncbi:hypothetical protein PC116_g24889 [Phytophthora cactorum]|uniref:Uncharacterized protein n=1 Tax=Phytophthora cactorum TaxID=29920 RepID=A0A8T1DVV5_9STRA|nr:hypothetical protein PC117_g8200 [Phytophthora cactorum]KAG3026974.1 hypothetical protein PC119_g7588 [Phytophthora cactorum]KAG3193960.1 hypothetical protein PC128_g9751 [Phytophthora cactorum]KAG4226709.1 hypothetical protein PC116_g24889 [Phytophthora cactorum]